MKLTCPGLILLIILCGSSTLVTSQDSCSSKLQINQGSFPFDTSSLKCSPVWGAHNFILRYAKASSSDVWNFVLSYPSSINSYAAIGFSDDGNMVGSSAIVGWIQGAGWMKGYYLGGKSQSQVIPDKGRLNCTIYIVQSTDKSMVYMGIQLYTNQPSTNLLYAIGPSGSFPDNQGSLPQHNDKISTVIDYSTGITREVSNLKLRRSHGVLNIASWSILMMIGSIIARYFKQWDPVWFYLHASIQTLGFVAGIAGILTGYALSKKLKDDVTNHKNVAILIFVLGLLQVFAIKLRPGPESKIRKYWNWYHHNVGRILIIFAVVNTFYGLSLGGEGSKWFLAYGVSVGILVIIAVILEVRMRIIARRETTQSSNPQSLEFAYHF